MKVARIEANSCGLEHYGNYVVEIVEAGKVVARKVVSVGGWGAKHADEAYAKAKAYAASHGCK